MKENLFIGQTKYTYKGQKNNPTRQKPVGAWGSSSHPKIVQIQMVSRKKSRLISGWLFDAPLVNAGGTELSKRETLNFPCGDRFFKKIFKKTKRKKKYAHIIGLFLKSFTNEFFF